MMAFKRCVIAGPVLAGLAACATAPLSPMTGAADQEVSTRPISGSKLIYPAQMVRQEIEGEVDVSCTVDVSGATSDCVILKIVGPMTFAEAATAFVKGARYRPAIRGGMPVAELNHYFAIKFVIGPLDLPNEQLLAGLSADWAQCAVPGPNYQTRIAGCDRAIETSAAFPPLLEAGYEVRANLHAAQSHYDQAVTDYDAAINTGFASLHTYRQRGLAAVALRDYQKAKSDLEIVLKATPDDVLSLQGRSRAELGLGEIVAARHDLDREILRSPDDPSLRIQRARIAETTNDRAAALTDLDAALRLNPTEVSALAARCRVYRSMARSSEAAADCAQVELVDPKHKIAADTPA